MSTKTIFPIIREKRCEIGYKLVLFTNRKLHTSFRLVPKLLTLVTLNGKMTVCLHASVFKHTTKNWAKMNTVYDKNVVKECRF